MKHRNYGDIVSCNPEEDPSRRGGSQVQAEGLGGSPCARLAPNHPSLQAALLGRWGRVLLEVGGQVLKCQVWPPASRWTCGAVVSPVSAKEGSLGPAHQDVPRSSFRFLDLPLLLLIP